MCDPVTIGVSLAGLALSKAMAPKPPKPPKLAPLEKLPEKKQETKAPNVDDVRRDNAMRAGGSGYTTNQSTLLTSPAGENESELNLGKATLLGE